MVCSTGTVPWSAFTQLVLPSGVLELSLFMTQVSSRNGEGAPAVPNDESNLLSHGFVTFLMQNRRRYNRLILLLHQGQEFYQSFKTCYGATPAQMAQDWVGKKIF